MQNPKLFTLVPGLTHEEIKFLGPLAEDLTDQQIETFANIYSGRRKSPDTILLTALLGFVIAAGVHRFILGQIGMGILYLLTGGLCFIGTIVDLVNYKSMTMAFNEEQAHEAKAMTLSVYS